MKKYIKKNIINTLILKSFIALNSLIILLSFSSCQQDSKEAIVSGNNVCVADPTCKPGSGYNGAAYQNYPGYTPYGYGQPFYYYNNNSYLCNCPYGSVPTFNSYTGLGCFSVRQLSFKPNFSAFFYLSWGNNQWSHLPQLYKYNYNTGAGYCYNGAAQSCMVNQPNSCPSGYQCRPNIPVLNSSTSSLGLCVANYR